MSTLAQGTESLRPSPLKWLAMVAISAAIVWAGVRIAGTHPALGWGCVVFFGLCGVVGLLNLLPGAHRLVIDDEGFEVRSLLRRTRVPWSNVARFGTTRVGLHALVGFDFASDDARGERLRRVNRGLSGFHAALPDTYGQPAAALAERMSARLDAWRQCQAGPR